VRRSDWQSFFDWRVIAERWHERTKATTIYKIQNKRARARRQHSFSNPSQVVRRSFRSHTVLLQRRRKVFHRQHRPCARLNRLRSLVSFLPPRSSSRGRRTLALAEVVSFVRPPGPAAVRVRAYWKASAEMEETKRCAASASRRLLEATVSVPVTKEVEIGLHSYVVSLEAGALKVVVSHFVGNLRGLYRVSEDIGGRECSMLVRR
jgi:hypothetical protein